MQKKSVVVSRVRKLRPSVSNGSPKIPALNVRSHDFSEINRRELRSPLMVDFQNGEQAKLSPDDRSFALHADILAELQNAGLPAFIELEPRTRAIANVRIPLSGRVVGLFRERSGAIDFQLDNSAKAFRFRRSDPKTRPYLKLLMQAQLVNAPVLVTEGDERDEILDLRLDDESRSRGPLEGTTVPPVTVEPVTLEEASEMFHLVATASCDPVALTSSCIPFQYVDNGCHARAHAMCRLIIAAGGHPAKVWNLSQDRRDPLVVETPFAKRGKALWIFHVAVALNVHTSGDENQMIIIDPSLFQDGPVSVEKWQAMQGSKNSSLLYTSPDPYLPPQPGRVETDPNFNKTNRELVRYRLLLKKRAGKILTNYAGRDVIRSSHGASTNRHRTA